jgi:phosphoglycolate phosphatase
MTAERLTSFIFDLDGTLIDSLPGIEFSVDAAFAACHLPKRQSDLRSLIGPPIRSILAHAGNVSDEKLLADLELAFRRSYDDEGWKLSTCYPGVTSVLQQMFEAGHRLFVVTNKPRHISIRNLDCFGLLPLFTDVITRDSRIPAFPNKGEIVRFLLSSHHLDPAKSLMVGDTIEDASAAAANHVRFAHVTHGYGKIAKNSPLPVYLSSDDFQQLSQQLSLEFAHD